MFILEGEEVEKALDDYLCERGQIIPEPGHEDALFLSMQKKTTTHECTECRKIS